MHNNGSCGVQNKCWMNALTVKKTTIPLHVLLTTCSFTVYSPICLNGNTRVGSIQQHVTSPLEFTQLYTLSKQIIQRMVGEKNTEIWT